MSLDTFISILFVVFIILFQVAGMLVERMQKSGGTSRAGSLIGTFMARIKKELEMAVSGSGGPEAAGAKAMSGWDELMPDEQREQVSQEPEPAPVMVREDAEDVLPGPGAAVILQPLEQDEDGIRAAADAESRAATAGQPLPDSTAALPSIQELRRAVAWSEILAPPLALREDWQPGRDGT
ncbi:MAG: hypothetical protein DRH32_10135 [Deltaproteobacteria bacterium]|nr:MAG: hypothetical protein DRH32_10135 [Deltaproteobacteria bacterium]